MLLCAPSQGTEILSARIPVGNQNGDSAEAANARGEQRGKYQHDRGEEGGSNASLEGLAG
ncbi:hypothetical protein GCM10010313_35380 [Streptomyces violarus]|nr:hypothetical protein GCM10010313_35380 [Streptomyces violarus]